MDYRPNKTINPTKTNTSDNDNSGRLAGYLSVRSIVESLISAENLGQIQQINRNTVIEPRLPPLRPFRLAPVGVVHHVISFDKGRGSENRSACVMVCQDVSENRIQKKNMKNGEIWQKVGIWQSTNY